jgi:putative transposase
VRSEDTKKAGTQNIWLARHRQPAVRAHKVVPDPKDQRRDNDGPPWRPNNPELRRLVQAKRQWHFHPDTDAVNRGFLGWHERGYLPHFDAPNVTQFVTFVLHDAFPVTRRREWEPILLEPDESLRRRRLEAWLDRGHGECWLGRAAIADAVEQLLLEEDGNSFRMRAWVLMPNHVHLVVDVWQVPLSKLLNHWKGRAAYQANRFLGRQGHFWQKEYFETLIRDERHLRQAVRYTENNPAKAGLVRDPNDWRWSSARRRDLYGRLPWQTPSE